MKKLTGLLTFILLISAGFVDANARAYFDYKIITPDLIDKPLEVGGKEWKEEIKTIIKLQKNPDLGELTAAAEERELKPEMILLAVDPELTRKHYPVLYKLLDNTRDTADMVTGNTKGFWKTNRPYLVDKKVKALVAPPANNAYPSGHTSQSFVLAYVLGSLIPEKRQQFRDRANQIANHRILVGMHYPHDIQGGKQLAFLVTGALLNNSDFQRDLTKARKELSSKH